jgi:outer membrane protein TolC
MGVVAHASYRVRPPSHISSPGLNPDKAVSQALSKRPDLQTLTEQALAQKQVVKFNQAQFFPTVQTVGAYSLDSEFFPLVYNWSVGTTLTVPIFNGFQFVHQTQQARAQMRQMLFQREDLRQQTIVEVRSDILNIRTFREKVAADREIVDQARQNLYLAENQFRVGTGTSVAVTQAERDLASARANLVRDRADLSIAVAQLRHDQGLNLDPVTHQIPRELP